MNKPKELIGEVKKFEDLIKSFINGDPSQINSNAHYQMLIYLFKITDFLTQDFAPSMIEKYFEGWEKVDADTHLISRVNNTDIEIYFNAEGFLEFWAIDLNGLDFTFPTPKTLSDFISNCLNADIKLEWKD